ncbi:MAG TPA: dihydrofolate reductase [Opitutaceae bacterium]|nr:dihydrofolate reductase [Opitutaceae bacterium]
MPKPLHLIVACAGNRVIGRDGRLPWKIPEDRQYFDTQTAGQIVVLGRVCFESWPDANQDGRRPVVVTRNTTLASEGVRVAASLDAALAIADTLPGEIYICGGQRIYEETLAMAAKPTRPIRLHLTLVHAEMPGDRFFPEWRHLAWKEISRRESADANYRYTFFELERE